MIARHPRLSHHSDQGSYTARLAAQLQVLPSVGGRGEFGGTRGWGERGVCDRQHREVSTGP